ncbi:Crp/Fnr family transcriptional regulator [Spirochaeta thermophila]|uniref:Crp/Fnr family transcriptional regulator n=1 Tax=Winmispira thermophila TaxID=154 RepID=UPI0006906C9F|nr:Crp/Fnr family transcriptional regulator [Spirochaeta thermophila]
MNARKDSAAPLPPLLRRLLQVTLFSPLSPQEARTAFTRALPTLHPFRRHQILLLQEEPYTALWVILEGSCAGEIVDPEGRTITVERFDAPSVLAPAVLFAPDPRLPVQVRALTSGKAAIFRKDDLLLLFRHYPALLSSFLADVSDKLLALSRRLSFLTLLSLRERLARYLLSLPADPDGAVTLPSTVGHLATYLGTTRPSLSRLFSRFRREGLVEKTGRRVRILDRGALTRILTDRR